MDFDALEEKVTSAATRRRLLRAAAPSLFELLKEAKASAPGQCSSEEGRTPQFNVTIYDRPLLDALSEALGRPRSEVINLALARLAQEEELWEGRYEELFTECGRRLLRILLYEFELGFEKAFTYLEEGVLRALPRRKFFRQRELAGEPEAQLRERFEHAMGRIYDRWKGSGLGHELPACQYGPPFEG